MKKKFKHKKIIILAVVLLVVAVIIFMFINMVRQQQALLLEAMNRNETALMEKRDLVSSISATGKVSSIESKDVTVALSGIEVEKINVKVGDSVKKGDILCVFDSEDIEEKLSDARDSLNSTLEKYDIDMSSAERSLSEAEAGRNIDAERADKDVADAWEDYQTALDDADDAKKDWRDAREEADDAEDEYDDCQKLIEETAGKIKELEEQLKNTVSDGVQSSVYESGFAETLGLMNAYISGESDVSAKSGTAELLSLANPALNEITAEHFDIANDESGEKAAQITEYLNELKDIAQKYQQSLAAETTEAAYQQAQAEYQKLQEELPVLQTKYNTLSSSESAMEAAYEQAKSMAESKLDMYNQKVRNQQDSARNNDSAVANRRDSVSSSRLSSSTIGSMDRQAIKQYEKQLEKCTVTAPMNGVITKVNLEAGDTYNGSPIVTIEDVSSYEISAEINEYDIGKVKEGQTVVFKTNGTGDEQLHGKVKKIAPRATAGAGAVTYNVTISIDAADDVILKMDMTAKISIIIEEKTNVLTVPYEAVQEDENGGYYIEVVKEGADTAEPENSDVSQATERIPVEKGIESDYYVEVIGDSLQEGMEVVVPNNGDYKNLMEMMMEQGAMGGF